MGALFAGPSGGRRVSVCGEAASVGVRMLVMQLNWSTPLPDSWEAPMWFRRGLSVAQTPRRCVSQFLFFHGPYSGSEAGACIASECFSGYFTVEKVLAGFWAVVLLTFSWVVFLAAWPCLSMMPLTGLGQGGVSGPAALLNSRSHVTFKLSVFYHHQKGRLITFVLENSHISRYRFCAHWCLERLWFASSSLLYWLHRKQSWYLYSPNCGPGNLAASTCHFPLFCDFYYAAFRFELVVYEVSVSTGVQTVTSWLSSSKIWCQPSSWPPLICGGLVLLLLGRTKDRPQRLW